MWALQSDDQDSRTLPASINDVLLEMVFNKVFFFLCIAFA